VRYTARQCAEGLQFLGLPQTLFEPGAPGLGTRARQRVGEDIGQETHQGRHLGIPGQFPAQSVETQESDQLSGAAERNAQERVAAQGLQLQPLADQAGIQAGYRAHEEILFGAHALEQPTQGSWLIGADLAQKFGQSAGRPGMRALKARAFGVELEEESPVKAAELGDLLEGALNALIELSAAQVDEAGRDGRDQLF
jgi:hypothetical protein